MLLVTVLALRRGIRGDVPLGLTDLLVMGDWDRLELEELLEVPPEAKDLPVEERVALYMALRHLWCWRWW